MFWRQLKQPKYIFLRPPNFDAFKGEGKKEKKFLENSFFFFFFNNVKPPLSLCLQFFYQEYASFGIGRLIK
jgi:hypothetical protein